MSAQPPIDDDVTIMAPKTGSTAGTHPSAAKSGTKNALPVGIMLDEFEIKSIIGQGGFSLVYLAYDHSLRREVAVKEYMPSAFAARAQGATTVSVLSDMHIDTFKSGLRSFVNEACMLAQFEHPSLVQIYRFWEANGTAYLVMPVYQDLTLKQALRQMKAPPDEFWLKYFLSQILDALEVIHAKQCYHRDIAPDNILMLEGKGPLLLDFGAARYVIDDSTQALTVILKPGYAPIEQYGDSPSMTQGAWTDIYALASVVYFAIMGKVPPSAVVRLMADPLVPLAKAAVGRYDDGFLRGIDAALAVRPENRPQNVAQFRDLLDLENVSELAWKRAEELEAQELTAQQSADFAAGQDGTAEDMEKYLAGVNHPLPTMSKGAFATYALPALVLLLLIAGIFWLMNGGR